MLTITIWLYLTLTLTYCKCHVTKLETSREIYFEEQIHNRAYDFSTTLLYRFPLSETDNMIENLHKILQSNRNATISQNFKQTIQNLLQTWQNLIKDFKNGNHNPSPRGKRGIMDVLNPIKDFFGDGLVLCCRAMTYRQGNKLVKDEINLGKSYNNLKEVLKKEHQDLFQVNNVVNKMSEHLRNEGMALKQKWQGL